MKKNAAKRARIPEQLSFTPGDFAGNTGLLISHFGLTDESEVPVEKFTLISDGVSQTTRVTQGKFKSALLLYYLSMLIADPVHEIAPFHVTDEMRKLIRDFYGSKLCSDAETDPETIHQTIRSLLMGEKVLVLLS